MLARFSLLLPALFAPQDFDRLATIQWTPSASGCYVRGTVPVPDGFQLEGAGLALNDVFWEGPKLVQVETVTRGPRGAPEVIEILAHMPGGRPPSRWAEVVSTKGLAAPNDQPAPHTVFRDAIRLRAIDAKGASYTAELRPGGKGHDSLVTLKSGFIHRQDRHAAVLMPDSPEEALHPHLFGVHAYLGNWGDDKYLTLDLRVHNGLIGPNATRDGPEAPVGPLYFEHLELQLPKGWGATADVRDPALGELELTESGARIQIVKSLGGELLHMVPPGGRFHRRLALYMTDEAASKERAVGHLNGEGAATCAPSQDKWSWSNPKTARYFPHRQLIPELSYFKGDGDEESKRILRGKPLPLEQHIVAGVGGAGLLKSPALGWAHPWFRSSPGSHGGEGVTFLEGLRCLGTPYSSWELKNLALRHRANCSRQPTASWRSNGEPTKVEDWLEEDQLPFQFHLVSRAALTSLRLPCDGGTKPLPELFEHVAPERRPPYDQSDAWDEGGSRPSDPEDLVTWQPHDGAHLIRFTSHAKALAWLTNDSLAKDALAHEAERVRFALPTVESPAPPMTTVRQLLDYAETHPKNGLPIGREFGWALDTVAAAYSLGSDEDRSRLGPWLVEACSAVALATPSSGVVIRNTTSARPKDRTHATAHAFQAAILQLGLRSATRSCLEGVHDDLAQALDRALLECVETLYYSPIFSQPSDLTKHWPNAPELSGPRWIFPVAPLGWDLPPFNPGDPLPANSFDGGVECHYSYALLAWAHELAPPNEEQQRRHLDRILDLGPRYKSWADLKEHLARQSQSRPGFDPLLQAAPALVFAPK